MVVRAQYKAWLGYTRGGVMDRSGGAARMAASQVRPRRSSFLIHEAACSTSGVLRLDGAVHRRRHLLSRRCPARARSTKPRCSTMTAT
jgi:hypothetical protein